MLQHILTTVDGTASQSVMDFARSHDYIMRKNGDGCLHSSHPNAHIAVIRVFRSLDADPILPHPSYGGQEYPPGLVPREGELLMELSNGWLRPWFRDVDGKLRKRTKNLFAPLGILFDNAVEYASSYYP
ncbi:hypothetical protein C8T65DRAFT_699486 [Cerioporus squamosus]|nr:hypothetical protein C8T65DRAFT_699486 [Cerioporus squamosus]